MLEGDALIVTKPDRLARSTADLLAIEADLSRRGIGLLVLSMDGERLDTRNPTSKLRLTILGGVATWEREIMLERQREGIAKAKAEGKYNGRKPTVAVEGEQIRAVRAAGEKPSHIARRLGVARRSVYRMLEGVWAPPAGCRPRQPGGIAPNIKGSRLCEPRRSQEITAREAGAALAPHTSCFANRFAASLNECPPPARASSKC
jgi:hypothetical protein